MWKSRPECARSNSLRLCTLLPPQRRAQRELYPGGPERTERLRIPGELARTMLILQGQYSELDRLMLRQLQRREAMHRPQASHHGLHAATIHHHCISQRICHSWCRDRRISFEFWTFWWRHRGYRHWLHCWRRTYFGSYHLLLYPHTQAQAE